MKDSWSLEATVDEALDVLEHRIKNYPQLEAAHNKALADNADLLEVIRGLRLDIETYKSTLEGLQRRVVRFEHLGNAIGEIA